MTVATACYCTREDVQQALDVKTTARSAAQIDRLIQSSARMVEGLLNRQFWVFTGTHKFDWPQLPFAGAFPWRMWLDANEVLTITTLTSGGTVIPSSGYLLEPVNYGPPYSHIDINLGTTSAFNSAATWQQSLVVTGTFGYTAATTPAGALAAAITTTTATTCDVTDGSSIGVGSTLVIESERMLVTGRQSITSGQTVQAPGLTGAPSPSTTLVVSDGTAFFIGEVLLVDSERLLILDIAGNNLLVKRAWDGTTLAAHTAGATIYASRRLTITRGAFGTTAATHLVSTAVTTAFVPPQVQSLAIAESINLLLSEESGYARTIGSGDTVRNASGSGLQDLRDRTYSEFARKVRMRSI